MVLLGALCCSGCCHVLYVLYILSEVLRFLRSVKSKFMAIIRSTLILNFSWHSRKQFAFPTNGTKRLVCLFFFIINSKVYSGGSL